MIEQAPLTEGNYEVRPFPRMRQLVLDAGWLGHRRHMIHGFIEVDVTYPRQLIRERAAQDGRKLSFTAFVLACIGQAVEQDRSVQAMRDWRNRLIIFDDVDVLITIEIPVGNSTFPLVHPIRAVNHRSVEDIHSEIRAIQAQPERSEGMQSSLMRWFCRLPTFSRRIFYRFIEANPRYRKEFSGTIGMTSLGMFGSGGGWGLGMPVHSLAVTLGGISNKPGWKDGRIQPGEFLNVTLSFDHDTIDGAPAARFANSFQHYIEAGFGLASGFSS